MKLQSKHFFSFFIFYFALRILLYFLNPTEVGDSYRFLNAGEYISRLSYPNFEKRLPLFPFILSFGVRFIDPIIWGRFVAQAISFGVLIFTYKIGSTLLKSKNKAFLAVVLTAFSPLFFYGTSRVLSEGLFSLLILISFWFYLKKERNYFIIGALCGLCFLTRYEGAILALSYGIDLLLRKDLKSILKMAVGFLLVSAFWVVRTVHLYAGAGNFEYASEPFGFSYNPKSTLVIVSSFLFLFGNLFISPVLIINSIKYLFANYRPIVIYVFLSILFFFFWIAAMPRLFTYLIPIFSIFVLHTLQFENVNRKKLVLFFVFLAFQFLIFRFIYRYHFLVLGKEFFVLFIAVSTLSFLAILLRRQSIALVLIVISSIVASLSYTYHYRNIYQTVFKACVMLKDFNGKIAYSDETGVSSWYLKNKDTLYFDSTSVEESVEYLRSQNVKWALVTNEFDEYRRLVFLEKKDNKKNVELVSKFQENDGGYIRYSKIYKIVYN